MLTVINIQSKTQNINIDKLINKTKGKIIKIKEKAAYFAHDKKKHVNVHVLDMYSTLIAMH